MHNTVFRLMTVSAALIACFGPPKAHAHALIDGLTGTEFNLTAKAGSIKTGDGDAFLNWGYANGNGRMQYPGPTLIVNQGATITVNLTNNLTVPVSIVFPGHVVTPTGGTPGLLTSEAAASGGTVSYSFTASQPGTYMYHSGTNPELQIEMGLVGALIVRPTGFDHMDPTTYKAYEHPDSTYTHEYLFLLTEMDPRIHRLIEFGQAALVDTTTWWPVLWFINGRNAPDTMLDAGIPSMRTQPYNCLPRMHPGEKLLLRIVSAGRDPHPFHTHGNNATVIARDGRLLQSAPAAGADLSVSDFTFPVAPGGTIDAIFEWTGQGLGWDIYGHQQDIDNAPLGNFPGTEDIDHNQDGLFDNVAMQANEYAPDHGKPFPVTLPQQQELTVGAMWSGSPFLGALGALPPGEGGMNMNGGYTYMWHSHAEKEMTNNDIFPGGLMTMLIIEPPGVPIGH